MPCFASRALGWKTSSHLLSCSDIRGDDKPLEVQAWSPNVDEGVAVVSDIDGFRCKAGCPQHPWKRLQARGASYATSIERQAFQHVARQRRYSDDVGHGQPPVRGENAAGLCQYSLLVGTEIDHAVRNDNVEAAVAKRKTLNLGLQEVYDRDASVGGMATGKANHFERHVDSDDPATNADLDGRS